MGISHCNEDDLRTIGECLLAAVEGLFFPDWEFSLLFGLERADVAHVMHTWPNVSGVDGENVDLAVNNAICNLLCYPHGEDLSQFVSAPRERLYEILEKWKKPNDT